VSFVCRRCGDEFDSDRAHHRYCWPCFRQLRETGRFGGERQPPPQQPPPKPPLDLDPRLLRDAIVLCHPDRLPPERARVANAVTAALLELLHTARKKGAA
jgi:hypothetical protein